MQPDEVRAEALRLAVEAAVPGTMPAQILRTARDFEIYMTAGYAASVAPAPVRKVKTTA